MRSDEQIKIQYAAKYAGIQNSYKKWQGEVLGLTSTNALGKKKTYEAEFQKRVNGNPQWKEQYGTLLGDLEAAYGEIKPYGYARDYYLEITSKIELFTIAGWVNSVSAAALKDGEKAFTQRRDQARNVLEGLFGEYNSEVDVKLFETLIEMYVKDQDQKYQSPLLRKLLSENGNDINKVATKLYEETILHDAKKTMQLLNGTMEDVMAFAKKDKAIQLYTDLVATYSNEVSKKLNEVQARINKLNRTYMQAQMDVFKEKTFYPDANSTLRVTYGKVKGYNPRDAVKYDYYTYLDGVMDKYVPGDYEFDVPEKIQTLYKNKDYGQYGTNGKMPVCFIAQNHTTGGNSGSPALDAYGNLVGLNFDRVWEGTMSDINYDPSICRNIMVDIRYVLFIVDKYAGASHLIKEMKLVHPKRK